MSDTNKLAYAGTPGPWITDKTGTKRGPVFMSCIHSQTGTYQTVADVFGSTQVEMEQNIAMISAAPEAVEFIADLMDFFDFLDVLKTTNINTQPWRDKAEVILKKAYNL